MVGMAAGSIEDLCARNIDEALLRTGDASQRQAEYITKSGNSDCCLLIRYYYKNLVNITKSNVIVIFQKIMITLFPKEFHIFSYDMKVLTNF